MLIAHGILPDLISQLSSYSFFGIAPIIWDQTEGQFKVKKSAITCIGTVITLQLGLCLIVHDWYNRHQLNNGNSHVANNGGDYGGWGGGGGGGASGMEKAYVRIQRFSCALLLFLVAFMHGRNMKSAHALVAFFNGMIAFEQKYTGRIRLPMDWKGKLTKYFCLVVRLFNNIGPILITVLITLSETSSPLNLIEFLAQSSSSSTDAGDGNGGGGGGGSGVVTGNNLDLSSSSSSGSASSLSGITIITGNQMVQRFITGTITALINLIIWYMVVNIRGFWTCGQVLIGCYGIRSALNLYASIMTRGKLLRITKEKMQEAVIYREIQLLTSLFNEVHGNSIFAILLLLSSLLQSVSLYLYVRFIAGIAGTSSFYFVPSSWTWTSSRLFIAYMVFDGIFIIFVVFGCCAEVYITSVQVKEQLQQNEVFQRSEWFTQFFISCPTIKFKAGSTNFISGGQLGYQAQQHQNHQQSSGLFNDSISGGENGRGIVTPSPSDAMFNLTTNGGSNNGGGGGGNNNGESNFGLGTGIYAGKMGNNGANVNGNGNGHCGGEAGTSSTTSHHHRHSISGSNDEYTVGAI